MDCKGRSTSPFEITALTRYEEFALDVGKLFIFSLGVTLLFRGVGWIASRAIGPIPAPSFQPQKTGGDTCSTS